MKKGQIYKGYVEKVNYPNKGVVRSEGETCVVKNVIPGQTVSFMVTKKRTGHYEGNLSEVLESAPDEIQSPCRHFSNCGGCTYQTLPYAKQLKLKEGQVKEMLKEALKNQKEEWLFEDIKASPKSLEYRNKMEFSFGDSFKGGPLALGLHKRGSFYDIENVYDCQIVDEDYRKILNITRNYFKDLPFYHKMRHEGYLRHLLIRKAVHTGEILVALVTSSQIPTGVSENLLSEWEKEILNIDLTKPTNGISGGKIKGILNIINDSPSDDIRADRIDILYGDMDIRERILGLEFVISPFSFFQTNSLGAEVLYSTVREYIGDLSRNGVAQATVFDLYSGTGTIAQLMASVSKKVIGVEIVEEAVEAARINARLNGLDNCSFIADDVFKALDEIEDRPDFIILDPPREGISAKALNKILAYNVERMIYISCKPTSLMRDLESILAAGYHVERACCVDMFPGTSHVESVVLLNKKKATDFVEIGVDAEDYYSIKEK